MPRKSYRIFIGTSGWNYNDWKGPFYPKELSRKEWFNYYTKKFDTVEINNTFYNLPSTAVFKNWKKGSPSRFIYAVKANRYITHMKKLKNPRSALKKFFLRVNHLKNNLGPILYQLPPHFKCNPERLEKFLKVLPKDKVHIFEFRDNSWFKEEVFKLLNAYKASFCVHDMKGVNCPVKVTGKIAYLRLHGTTGKYQGAYPLKTLKAWARWIRRQAKTKDVYVYFNNDTKAHAPKDAIELKKQKL